MRILVTGATGFIGSHLVRKLARDGFDVTALVRKNSSLKFLPKKNIRLIYGDVRDKINLISALKEFDVIFHNGAFACDWGRREDFYEINLEGTKNILQAMAENKIKKLILTSTAAVLGEEDCPSSKNEESPFLPRLNYFCSRIFESDMNHYRISKMQAEKEAMDFSSRNAIDLTVIRPVWVYGPREFNAGPYYFCKHLLGGVPFLPVGKSNLFSVVYVEDLVEAMVLVLRKNLRGINIFIIGNEDPPLAREYLRIFSQELGKKLPAYIPEIIFAPIGFFLELCYKMFKKNEAPMLTRARAKVFYCNNIFEPSKAKNELGFIARTPLEIGIKKTVRWYRQNGFLK